MKLTSRYTQWLLLLILMLFSTISANASELPDIGNSADNLLSADQEERLGKEFMRSIRQRLTLIDDPVSNDYIRTLGDRLASQLDGSQHKFRFFLVDDPSINAFAGPAGYIGIHTGLILATQSESELASVVAHEIAHVTQRHLVRQFESRSNMSMATMAAVIAAVLLGSSNPEVSEAVLASTVAGNIEQQLSFSRAHEKEADRVGIDMLANAGYDPRSMAHFFETLQNVNRFNDTGLPEFIMTHPVTATRIADSRNRAMQLVQRRQSFNSSISYPLFIARIKYHSRQNPDISKEHAQTTTVKSPHQDDYSGRYEQVLRLLKQQQLDKAREQINSLIRDDRTRIPYIITKTEIEIASGNIETAIDILARALILYPQNQILSLSYAESLLLANKSRNAMSVLQGFIRNRDAIDLRMYKVYASAADMANFQSEAYQTMGEYHYLLGHTHTAIQNLEQAVKQKDTDTYQKLRLEARIEQFKQEMLKNQADLEK